MKCNSCRWYGKHAKGCLLYECDDKHDRYERITNGEAIRRMSDERIAMFLNSFLRSREWMDWLGAPADDDMI